MKSYTNKKNNRLNLSVVVQDSSPVQKGHPSTAQSRAENSAILKDYYNAKKQMKPTLWVISYHSLSKLLILYIYKTFISSHSDLSTDFS